MKVRFKNKNINIKNELETRADFVGLWNGYTIEVHPSYIEHYSNGRKKTMYEAYVSNPMGYSMSFEGEKISTCAQEIFEWIEADIEDLHEAYKELKVAIENLKDYLE